MKEVWAVLYLHEWDPDGKVYPEIHSVHHNFADANEEVSTKMYPEKYWVRRSWLKEQQT